MDNNLNALGLLSSFLSVTLANVQELLSVISLILSLLFTCFLIIKAIKNSLKDGKITKEELDQLKDLTDDAINKGKELQDKLQNKGGDNKDV